MGSLDPNRRFLWAMLQFRGQLSLSAAQHVGGASLRPARAHRWRRRLAGRSRLGLAPLFRPHRPPRPILLSMDAAARLPRCSKRVRQSASTPCILPERSPTLACCWRTPWDTTSRPYGRFSARSRKKPLHCSDHWHITGIRSNRFRPLPRNARCMPSVADSATNAGILRYVRHSAAGTDWRGIGWHLFVRQGRRQMVIPVAHPRQSFAAVLEGSRILENA